jgi:hypothetical protein
MVKPKDVGYLFLVSYLWENCSVWRQLVPIRFSPCIKEHVALKTTDRVSWVKRYQAVPKRPIIHLKDGNVDLDEIMKAAIGHYGRSRLIVSSQLMFTGKKPQVWLPSWAADFSETYDELEKSAKRAEELKNNGGAESAIYFFNHLRELHKIDLSMQTGIKSQATLCSVANEFKSFRAGFEVWLT